jgi:LuxR family maltose regulon positive regulatory protein
MSVPLLQTKLYAPPVRAQLIHRRALTAKFSVEGARPLTLVAAPAGFGKTTLVSQWLAQADQPVAWLSLDDDDNDPARFLTYLIAALQTAQPHLGASVLSLLAAPQPPPLKALLTWLLDELGTLSTPLTLILDDYHFISAQPIHDALAFFIDHLPPAIRLVVTSRIDPPLPLSRWRVRNQLVEIRTDDLRFTPDETDLFLNHLSGLNLTAAQVANLEAKTEGWAAGLQLAALSLHDRRDIDAFIAAFAGTYRYIMEYMTEEVLRRQQESVQSFLLQTAILERLSGSLCDALLGRADGEATLEQLVRANVFVIPLDDQGYWYRYHHLFADLLRHYLHRTGSPFASLLARELKGDVRELHRRAAAWYEGAGLPEDAIHHALAAQEFAWVGRLILDHAEARLARGEMTLLLRWLAALPEPWLQSQLQLQLLQAGLLFLTGKFDEIHQRLPHIEQAWSLHQIEATESQGLFSDQEIPGLIAALQAEIALFRGEMSRALPLFRQALAQLDRDILGLRSVMGHNLALNYFWPQGAGEQDTALAAEFGAPSPQPDALSTLMALGQRAGLKRRQGQYRQSIALLRQILHMAAESARPAPLPIIGLAHGELSHLLYEANELAAAEAHAHQGIELGAQGAGMAALIPSHLGLALVKTAQQRFAEASDAIDQLELLARRLGSGPFVSQAAFLRMYISLL